MPEQDLQVREDLRRNDRANSDHLFRKVERMTTEELRNWVKSNYIETKKLRELSDTLKVSKSKLSLFASGKYCGNERELVLALKKLSNVESISRRDERRLLEIRTIINGADNPKALLATLTNAADDE